MDTIEQNRRTYLPAAGHDLFLPLYDPIVKLLGAEPARKALLDQADIRPGHHILDIGCGTGSLVVLISRLHPQVKLVGLDPDPKALGRARKKAQRARVSIQFDQGFADQLPYQEESFDRVFSSFMFHHLEEEQRESTLREVRRVLKRAGSFHMLDFAGPSSNAERGLARLVHSSHRLRDNAEGRVLTLMRQAGFAGAEKIMNGKMFFGLIRTTYYQASIRDEACY